MNTQMTIHMENYSPLREKPIPQKFKKDDILVLFGELFNRGYANGLVEEAESCGMTVIRATVGRRDENQNLRGLTAEESELIPKPFINIPLEAGFDLEKDSEGQCPNDYLKSVKLSEWENASVPEKTLNESQAAGQARFKKQTADFISEVQKYAKPNSHVHFAHLMAGGVPRTKIVMPLMNRVFKGVGDRHLSSTTFWNSKIGSYLKRNFSEVTANTFNILIEQSTNFRADMKKQNTTVSYVAYGYHGTEIIIEDNYKWQSYAPYIQGWAKIELENFAKNWSQKGVNACVYNCPEILTNSSSLFQGLEIPLYNLVRSLQKEIPNHPLTQKMKSECENVLNDPADLEKIFQMVDQHMIYSEKIGTSIYKNWPQHSIQEQLERSLKLSDDIIALHKDEKNMMSPLLSEIIFKSCGYVMLHDGFKPKNPVSWIGHDMISKCVPV